MFTICEHRPYSGHLFCQALDTSPATENHHYLPVPNYKQYHDIVEDEAVRRTFKALAY